MSKQIESVDQQPSNSSWYRQVLGTLPTGVCVVTTTAPDGMSTGMAVGSLASVSLDPPLISFMPDKRSATWGIIERSGRFCANILAADQEDICRTFASKDSDKFSGIAYRLSENGCPIIEDAVAWVDCNIETVVDAGDHQIVIGRVKELRIERLRSPLIFFKGGYGQFHPLPPTVIG
jgi:3-hydroxy-9,10-secoandrosta-1,3,5(10)-triene-9,17-dione monooxygenase reductase component